APGDYKEVPVGIGVSGTGTQRVFAKRHRIIVGVVVVRSRSAGSGMNPIGNVIAQIMAEARHEAPWPRWRSRRLHSRWYTRRRGGMLLAKQVERTGARLRQLRLRRLLRSGATVLFEILNVPPLMAPRWLPTATARAL